MSLSPLCAGIYLCIPALDLQRLIVIIRTIYVIHAQSARHQHGLSIVLNDPRTYVNL